MTLVMDLDPLGLGLLIFQRQIKMHRLASLIKLCILRVKLNVPLKKTVQKLFMSM